jgi:dTDP-D-glucose 4,6-dehydratase
MTKIANIHTPQSVMITGGCGFIASNFINHIARWYVGRVLISQFSKLIYENALIL